MQKWEFPKITPPSLTIQPPSGRYMKYLVKQHCLSHTLTEYDIKMGAFYNSHMPSDYDRPCFNHQLAQLKQLNIHRLDKKLVPLWKLYDALKPGTLILANISLHCYVYNKKTKAKDGHKVKNNSHPH